MNDAKSIYDAWQDAKDVILRRIDVTEFDRLGANLLAFLQGGGDLSDVALAYLTLKEIRLKLNHDYIKTAQKTEDVLAAALMANLRERNKIGETIPLEDGRILDMKAESIQVYEKPAEKHNQEYQSLVFRDTMLREWIHFIEPEYEINETEPLMHQALQMVATPDHLMEFFIHVTEESHRIRSPLWDLLFSFRDGDANQVLGYFYNRGQIEYGESLFKLVTRPKALSVKLTTPKQRKN